jgi:hypothetical protein
MDGDFMASEMLEEKLAMKAIHELRISMYTDGGPVVCQRFAVMPPDLIGNPQPTLSAWKSYLKNMCEIAIENIITEDNVKKILSDVNKGDYAK